MLPTYDVAKGKNKELQNRLFGSGAEERGLIDRNIKKILRVI